MESNQELTYSYQPLNIGSNPLRQTLENDR